MDYLLVIVFGAIWGSFANVCIYRIPKNEGVLGGRSHCPNCKKKIEWFDNIPVLSFIFLLGKCRNCKKQINIQYIIVEGISAISFIVIYYCFSITLTTLLLMMIPSILGPLWVWWLIDEVPSSTTLVGGALVLAAVAGWALRELRSSANE